MTLPDTNTSNRYLLERGQNGSWIVWDQVNCEPYQVWKSKELAIEHIKQLNDGTTWKA